MHNRRRFLGRSLAALLPAALPLAVRAADLPRMHVGAITISDCVPFYAAMQQGYFPAAGIDVSTESETGGTRRHSGGGCRRVRHRLHERALGLAGDRAGHRPALRRRRKHPQPARHDRVVRPRGEGIKTGKDFEGKTIGINDTRSLQFMYAHGWVKATGGDPDKVSYRAVPFPDMADAVKNKRVDGVIPSEPFFSAQPQRPGARTDREPRPHGVSERPRRRLGRHGRLLTKHGDLVRKFLAGMEQGSQWCNANLNSPAFTALLVSYTKLAPARVAAMAKGRTSIGITAREVARMADLMRVNGLLTATIDVPPKVYVP